MMISILAISLALSPKAELGRLLFFEVELSGNRNISCADCHHPDFGMGDGISLSVGEGGEGLGPDRTLGVGVNAVLERVPRNAPSVFGLANATRLFHDGRIEFNSSFPSGIKSPADHDLPEGLDSLLAAQAMFPVTSSTEMAGQAHENEIGRLASEGHLQGIWDALAYRLQRLPYVGMFYDAYPGLSFHNISMVHAANAIGAFEEEAFPSNQSPYLRYLMGECGALTSRQFEGLQVFNKAGCATCHSGPLLSDFEFHAIAMPQFGPGKHWSRRDTGREEATGHADDWYKFRTPPLTNVALTAPYGHSGAYRTLEGVVSHHLDPIGSLYRYDCFSEPILPSRADLDMHDCDVMQNSELISEIALANELAPVFMTAYEFGVLIDFLHALTDPNDIDRSDVIVDSESSCTVVDIVETEFYIITYCANGEINVDIP